MKYVLKGLASKEKMKIGIDAVADLVMATLGPKGGNICIEREFDKPLYTNDGWTAGRSMSLPDPVENMGCDLSKNVLERANTDSKGSRSTALTLFKAFIEFGVDMDAVNSSLKILEVHSQKIETEGQLIQLATISAGNEEVGKIVGKAVYEMGPHAALTVQESSVPGISIQIEQGMSIEQGFIQSDADEVTLKNIDVYLTHQTLTGREISDIINACVLNKIYDLFIVADSITNDAIELLDVNRLNKAFNGVVIRTPGYGDEKHKILEDIAAYTHTDICPKGKITMGKAQSVTVTRESTIIMNDKNTKLVQERLASIRQILEKEEDDYEKEKLSDRIANLDSGIGVISIGGYSDSSLKVLIQKAQDAIQESKSALEFGFIEGGGVGLLKASGTMVPLQAPFRTIVSNAGEVANHIAESVINNDTGYDSKNKKYGNMIELGIIDSLKTIQNAVLFAAHEAEIFLTTVRTVAHIPIDLKELEALKSHD